MAEVAGSWRNPPPCRTSVSVAREGDCAVIDGSFPMGLATASVSTTIRRAAKAPLRRRPAHRARAFALFAFGPLQLRNVFRSSRRGSGQAASSAWSRSPIRSRASSMPTERRTSCGVMPAARRRGSGIDAWLMVQGWLARLSTALSHRRAKSARGLRHEVVDAAQPLSRASVQRDRPFRFTSAVSARSHCGRDCRLASRMRPGQPQRARPHVA